MFRRPQRTLLPGLGVASAVLAGVLVAMTFAASVIGVDLPLGSAPTGPGSALEIEARERATAQAREQARALRIATVRPSAAPAPARAAERTATTRRVDTSTTLSVERGPVPEHRGSSSPPALPARSAGPSDVESASGGAAATPQASPRNPLEPLGSGVNDTTDGVANTLRSLSDELGDGVAPLSPELGGVLTNTGDALGDVVEGTGNVLGQLLGRPAGPR